MFVLMRLDEAPKLYGRVDRVPGQFYIATEFSQILLFPVSPRQSFLVSDGSERNGQFLGTPVPLCARSVVVGYTTTLLLFANFIAWFAVLCCLSIYMREEQLLGLAIAVPMALGVFLLLLRVERGFKASPQRAKELAQLAQANSSHPNADDAMMPSSGRGDDDRIQSKPT